MRSLAVKNLLGRQPLIVFRRLTYEYLCRTKHRKRPQYGSRVLKDDTKVFEFNAWDNVEWDAAQEEVARNKVLENSSTFLSDTEIEKFEIDAGKYWDAFYEIHQNRFFKDRHWLFTEFPELGPETEVDRNIPVSVSCTKQPATECERKDLSSTNFHGQVKNIEASNIKDSCNTSHETDSPILSTEKNAVISSEGEITVNKQPLRIFEIGCGVGNTVFPILQYTTNPDVFVYACDFSGTAVKLLKENPEYDPERCHAFVCNVTADDWEPPFEPNSLDVVAAIFVMSAIHPDRFLHVAKKIFYYLRPGGLLVFRDYGRYDMTQLRFKKGQCLGSNFYARGDGTRVYFFTQDEVRNIFTTAGFVEEQNLVDRRLQVNRSKMLKMYRVWIQAKFRKITSS